MHSFLYMERNAFPSLLFRQAKGCIKVGEPAEPSATPLLAGAQAPHPQRPGLQKSVEGTSAFAEAFST